MTRKLPVSINNLTSEVICTDEQTLMSAVSSQYQILSPCGGQGKCGKCKVPIILENGEKTSVLACQTKCKDLPGFCTIDISNLVVEKDRESVTSSSKTDVVVDLGTTTIEIFFPGSHIIPVTMLNAQSSYGSDVITRLAATEKYPLLQKLVISQIDSILSNVEVNRMLVVGNPAMIFLASGKDPYKIAHAPFILQDTDPFTMQSKELGFSKSFPVRFGGGVASYFGSDLVYGIAYSQAVKRMEKFLYLDIGTNGEMAMSDGKRIVCCSTAAGPVFEGSGISCGMVAKNGAIKHVHFEEGGLKIEKIGNGEPRGICGSGIIDCIAGMLESGLVDEDGSLSFDKSFKIHNQISITQSDIRQFQLAVAAMKAGIDVMLESLGMKVSDLCRIYTSGTLGSKSRPESCRKVGIIPDCKADVICLGNAAGLGATEFMDKEDEIEDLRSRFEYIELFNSKSFSKKYIECMSFGKKATE